MAKASKYVVRDASKFEKPKRGRKPIDDSEHIKAALSGGYLTANEAAYGVAQMAIDSTKEPELHNALYCRLRDKLKPHF